MQANDAKRKGYNDYDDEEKGYDRDEKAHQQPGKYRDIGSLFGCNSSLLTLSFHVKQQHVIKMYLYFNGQCMRFMPEDITTILPVLFNMEHGDNSQWIRQQMEVNQYIDRMERCLKDVEFEAFQQSYM